MAYGAPRRISETGALVTRPCRLAAGRNPGVDRFAITGEGSPRLGRRGSPFRHEPGNRTFGNRASASDQHSRDHRTPGVFRISRRIAPAYRHGRKDPVAGGAGRAWGTPVPLGPKLRLDHGALAALLVLTPTDSIIATIRSILAAH